ncbi:hypothetical protein G7054_g10431 [Neopestalotiopsis clavispora]|nr:hypothetical protein G7054_g10431 [Neopestalotiopsis clavispora]
MTGGNIVAPQTRGYQPLDPGGREIRIIRITVSVRTESNSKCPLINCYTEVTTFDDQSDSITPYRALSYTWGDTKNLVPIFLDGQAVRVTENLAVALQHLAHSHPGAKFWIDAISIDQENEIEKSRQVSIMGNIFKRASEVIVWIGPNEQGSAEAMDVLRQIGEACQEVLRTKDQEASDRAIEQHAHIGDKNESTVLAAIGSKWFPGNVPAFNPVYISHIFQRPWFRRVWVLQEARVNYNVTFHCGDEKISKTTLWAGGRAIIAMMNNAFSRAGFWVADDPLWRTLSGANFISRRTMDLARSDDTDFTLEELLLETSTNLGEWSYEASDPRDRVYAIMGLACDLSTLGLSSNYEKSCEDAYTAAAEKILRNSGTIDILYAVTWPKKIAGMPSWVPDWTTSVPATFGLRKMGRFSASGKASRATPTFTSHGVGGRIMTLFGHRLDRVRIIFPPFYDAPIESEYICQNAIRRIVGLLRDLTRIETTAYNSLATRNEAFWRAPIADCDAIFNINHRYRPAATRRMKESYDALMTLSSEDACCDLRARTYLHVMKLVAARRRLFVSDRGYIGLGADDMRSGDVICLLFGGDSPFLLRDTAMGHHQLVGEAYVHGVMHGEFLSTKPQPQEFRVC